MKNNRGLVGIVSHRLVSQCTGRVYRHWDSSPACVIHGIVLHWTYVLWVVESDIVCFVANGADMASWPATTQEDFLLWCVTVNKQGSSHIVQLSRHAGQPVVEVQRCEYFVPRCLSCCTTVTACRATSGGSTTLWVLCTALSVMLYNCHGMQGNQWWKYNVVSTLYHAVCHVVQLSRHAGQPVVEVQRCEYFVPRCVLYCTTVTACRATSGGSTTLWVLCTAVCYIVQLSRHAGQPVVEVQRCEYFVPRCVLYCTIVHLSVCIHVVARTNLCKNMVFPICGKLQGSIS